MTTKTEIKAKLAKKTGRSAWEKGVIKYAKDMVDDLEGNVDYTKANITKHLLNGASSWKQASYGGSGLIYNGDIAKRLCTPSELKKVQNGRLEPNKRENWLDVQARAMGQAATLIRTLV